MSTPKNLRDEEGCIFNNEKTVVAWPISSKEYLLQTSDAFLARRIKNWSFAELSSECINFNQWVFKIPKKKWAWVCTQLDFPLPHKSPGRVLHGKKQRLHLKKGAQNPRQF